MQRLCALALGMRVKRIPNVPAATVAAVDIRTAAVIFLNPHIPAAAPVALSPQYSSFLPQIQSN
jgi:hypothetical protein